jgi:hypothetical protein
VCEVPEELARVLLSRPADEGWSLEPDPEPENPEGDGGESPGGSEGEGPDGAQGDDGGDRKPGDDSGGDGEPRQPAKAAARKPRGKAAGASS